MKPSTVLSIGFFLILPLLTYSQNAQDSKATSDTSILRFDPNRNAAKDIQNAIVEAKRTNRRILLDVGGEWCVWCRRLDTLFMTNKDLSEFEHKNYVVVKINFSKENENNVVLSKYPKIEGYPHIFVLDTNGKLLHSQDTGKLESGKHHDPVKVMAFLKEWAPAKRQR